MKKFAHVSSPEATLPLSIEGTTPFVDSLLVHSFWDSYVIGDVVIDSNESDSASLIRINESSEHTYDIIERSIDCTQAYAASGIKYAAHFLEQERQQHGVYTVHGNVISLGSQAIACVGGISGIGKTSLSSKAHTQGWEWTSDEKFLMDESGHYVRGLNGIQDDLKSDQAALGMRPSTPRTKRSITGFVIPIIAEQPLVVHEYDLQKAEYHIYEELGRNITAGRAILRGYDTPLPSLDTAAISVRRYKCAQKLAAHIPFYFMIGEASALLERCEEIIAKNN